MHGKKSARGFKLSKCFVTGIVLFMVVSFCVIIYWWALAPIVSRFFRSENCIYHDLKFYTEDDYLDFEDGDVFEDMLSDIGVPAQGKATDFYYVDNCIEDNPIYGKMCDIYALDVTFEEEWYLDERKHYEESNENPQIIGDYALFASSVNYESRKFVRVAAFCDKTYTIRYILVTDSDTIFLISNVFSSHSNLNWEATMEQ